MSRARPKTQILTAARAVAWSITRPRLIDYFLSACRNADTWAQANYRNLGPILADAAVCMFMEMIKFCPEADPTDLFGCVADDIFPVLDEGENLGGALGNSDGAWLEWIQEAWRAARWRFSGASPCSAMELVPFLSLPLLHRNHIRNAILQSLDAVLPALKAQYIQQHAMRTDLSSGSNVLTPAPGDSPLAQEASDTAPGAGDSEVKATERSTPMLTSLAAVRRMESFMKSKGLTLTEFATRAGTTDRTLRKFRKTGTARRDIFDGIARAVGLTREELLKPE